MNLKQILEDAARRYDLVPKHRRSDYAVRELGRLSGKPVCTVCGDVAVAKVNGAFRCQDHVPVVELLP